MFYFEINQEKSESQTVSILLLRIKVQILMYDDNIES